MQPPAIAIEQTDLSPARLAATPNKQIQKKARYLSQWKVKRNGRLHIPINDCAGLLLNMEQVIGGDSKGSGIQTSTKILKSEICNSNSSDP